jgi:predicted alpha/beta hydrolase family esterase
MTNKPNIIMLHGWSDGDISNIPEFLPDSEQNWMGWTKKQLEDRGYKVDNPFLQDCYKSDYEGWKKGIEGLDINENTILVGWSSGGAFWVRWLGETKQVVKKLILVAPSKVVGNSDEVLQPLWKLHDEGEGPEYKKEWDSFHDFECDVTIKDRVESITIFVSDDMDWLVEASRIYARELEGNLIEIEGQGHFTKDKRLSPEFPELLEVILE